MNYILLLIMIVSACVYFLFGYDPSQQWFKSNAVLVNLLVAIIAVVATILSLLLALRGRSNKVLARKSNVLEKVKVSGKNNKLEIKQTINK